MREIEYKIQNLLSILVVHQQANRHLTCLSREHIKMEMKNSNILF
jgi:hypothetical protein